MPVMTADDAVAVAPRQRPTLTGRCVHPRHFAARAAGEKVLTNCLRRTRRSRWQRSPRAGPLRRSPLRPGSRAPRVGTPRSPESTSLGARSAARQTQAVAREGWKVELQGRGLSDSTIRSAVNGLETILDTALRDEARARNVPTTVMRPKIQSHRAAFDPEEVRRVLEAADGFDCGNSPTRTGDLLFVRQAL